MTEQTLPNGLPPQFSSKQNITPSPIPFNGVDSSHSSRTSSPANRLQQIPASQLPPSRTIIPASQLPPSANINQLVQNYSHLSVSQQATSATSSPKVQTFTTSTPVLTPIKSDAVSNSVATTQNFQQNREFSPIVPLKTVTQQETFTHSTHSHFTNVPVNTNNNNNVQNKTDPNQFQNIPLVNEIRNSNIGGRQGESNNSTQIKPTSTGSVVNPFLNNPQLNNQFDKNRGNVVQQDKVRISQPQGQTNAAQAYSSFGGFFQQNRQTNNSSSNVQAKMQHSVSQPSLDVNEFKDVPLSGSMSHTNQAMQQPPKPVHSFGSTSNLYHNQGNPNLYSNVPQNRYMSQSKPHFPQPPPSLPPQKPPYSSINSQTNVINPAITTAAQSNIHPSAAAPPLPVPVSTTQSLKANLHANRYPNMIQQQQHQNSMNAQFQTTSAFQQQNQNVYDYQKANLQQPQRQQPLNNYNQPDNLQQNYQPHQNYNQQPNVVQSGFSKLWGHENYDLLQCPNILPPFRIEPPKINLGQDFLDAANCSSDIFRCTMTKIPETNTLLQKSRLPLGILIHPFKDLDHLPVIQCSTIVRCRACRTYINPFVFFVDMKRWKCNLCYRVNELPEEFQFDPVSKTYGDPSRRPEIKSSTIEYIAPSEYMLRPPQPAVYLFLLDVSHAAIESEYLHVFCNVLATSLASLPGDARTQVGFIAFNSALHFYSLADGLSQPHEMTVLDIDDVFLPCPDNLIVNLHERKELIADLLAQLPTRFNNSYDRGSALGAALQAAHKMIASTGGRITVFQASLPTVGPGALAPREDPNQRAGAEVHHLNPANDFYKRLALECSGQQIAVDLFVVNSQYVDLATISGISRFSGGCIHHFPLFKASRTLQATSLERTFKRYLTRKIGFEAVMRIRCTRGLSIHTFHGNFFVRSTDLLSLPNVNPEAGFGMQVSIDESLSDLHTVCFQAALLYTSSKGERRIRVHTLCVPIATTLPDVIQSADQQCIVGLLAKMAVDRSMQSSLADAREAFINVAIDILSSYKLTLNLGSGQSGLLVPHCMKLLPLYISALLKHVAFRTGSSTRLDDRVKAMCDMKSLPLYLLIQKIYPDLYPVHNLEDQNTTLNVDGEAIPQPPHLQLTARNLDSKGAFLMDMGEHMVLLIGQSVSHTFLNEALGVPDYNSISEEMFDLPNLETPHNQRLNNFINYLNDEKPLVATLHIIRENSPSRNVFIEHLIEDRIETALSYHEFLQHLKTQVK